ncbi:hypothetical protein BD410DRAFT_708177, partial [Rickenella mellea]
LAIQIEDIDVDAVVITAFPRVPYCCPDELVEMSRSELLNVVAFMNESLPVAGTIDTGVARRDEDIKREIEGLL